MMDGENMSETHWVLLISSIFYIPIMDRWSHPHFSDRRGTNTPASSCALRTMGGASNQPRIRTPDLVLFVLVWFALIWSCLVRSDLLWSGLVRSCNQLGFNFLSPVIKHLCQLDISSVCGDHQNQTCHMLMFDVLVCFQSCWVPPRDWMSTIRTQMGELSGLIQSSPVLSGPIRSGTACSSLVRSGPVWHDLVWSGLVQPSLVCSTLVWSIFGTGLYCSLFLKVQKTISATWKQFRGQSQDLDFSLRSCSCFF